LEPWEKVYIKLRAGQDVADIDSHLGRTACVDCHNGNNKEPNNKEKAHEGLIVDPSEYVDGTNSCGKAGCHESKVGDYKNSLHQQLWGEKRMVALRSGVNSFTQCPQTTQDGYNGECTDCHATCGQCHISIPNSAGGGFPKNGPIYNSHRFRKTPDMKNNCTACHGSRIAHDFYGDEEAGRKGDTHYLYAMDCMDCHSNVEMHSAVADKDNTHRYNYDHLPRCENCHSDIGTANNYHSIHLEKVSCFVCHAVSTPGGYNNCTGCHVAGEWKTDPEYQERNPEEDFKIGRNPLKSDSRPYDFVTLRHIPIVRTSYDNWGASGTLVDYDDYETWKYATPHSIQRWTSQTDTTGGKTCSEKCHITNGENSKLYLFEDYIQTNWPNEINANKDVVVDGHLPSWWSK